MKTIEQASMDYALSRDDNDYTIETEMAFEVKYGYCPYCFRYIGSGYIYTEHKRLCKNVSAEVREINQGNIEYNRIQMNKNK